LKFGDDDLQPGGRYHDKFMTEFDYMKSKTSGASNDENCDFAELMFGPGGKIMPNWMKKR
jgi:hypothetical protein